MLVIFGTLSFGLNLLHQSLTAPRCRRRWQKPRALAEVITGHSFIVQPMRQNALDASRPVRLNGHSMADGTHCIL